MTKEELKQAIDNFIGLASDVDEKRSGVLVYKSNTGIPVFEITISDYGDGWQFGGMSGALSNAWQHLCRIHHYTEHPQ